MIQFFAFNLTVLDWWDLDVTLENTSLDIHLFILQFLQHNTFHAKKLCFIHDCGGLELQLASVLVPEELKTNIWCLEPF